MITISLDLSVAACVPNVRPRRGQRRPEPCGFYDGLPTIASARTAMRE
ncbi:MAG TPA: hypothetical protein VL308_04725 [Gemmatimonadaceae bacterium]|nr:hypothetical protein [Gemmatimonadaceae bacterium]